MRHVGSVVSAAVAAVGYVMLLAPGCGGTQTSGFPDGTADGGALLDEAGNPIFGDGGGTKKQGCVGLQCQQVTCAAGQDTTVSGTAFAPNGTLQLYNVIVYVPNAKLDPIPKGASCDKCGAQVSGSPVVTALSDSKGNFVLHNVPVGKNIPLVLQVGKWRRQVTIPEVVRCADTKLTDVNLTRLPKNQAEGDIPKIAVTTGGCDPLACILPKIGLEASEFGLSGNTGAPRVNIYQGVGGGTSSAPNATTLWGDVNSLKAYDIVILSCECNEHRETKPAAAVNAIEAYANMGGRIFGSHYHYSWFQYGSAGFQSTADWLGDGNAPPDSPPYLVDTSFPKGVAFSEWLVTVGASTTKGEVPLNDVHPDVGGVKPAGQRWISGSTKAATQYLSFNTPVGTPAADQCGKAVYGDIHISSQGGRVDNSFPTGCKPALTPQEKALAFLLFDLSSCIQPDGTPPMPPKPR